MSDRRSLFSGGIYLEIDYLIKKNYISEKG